MTLLWVVLIFLAACALILTEFVLPGGVLGLLGAVLLVGGCAWGMVSLPHYAVFILVGEALGATLTVMLGMFLIAKTSAGKALRLETVMSPEAGYVHMETDTSLIGKTGIAATPLRPAGIIEVDGRRLDVTADGAFVARGESVRVIAVSGSYITVEKAEGAPA